uniref:Uncharacterized protein n=1 Tax=Timema cristinae TaxID=61476 RepID=A0A7R9D719_TIMCR|nr:unnamed protein product [Timema cristinae]
MDTTECKTRALNLLSHGPLLTRRRKEELPERPFTAPGGPMRPQLKPLKLPGTTQKSLQRSKRPTTALPSCGHETGSKDRLPPCNNSIPGWFRSSDSMSGGLTTNDSLVSLKTKCIGDRKPVIIESDYPLDPAQDILEASKRWRLKYRSFRAQHSNRWQKESDVLDSKSKLHPRPRDTVNDAEKSSNLDQSFNEVSLPKLPKIV